MDHDAQVRLLHLVIRLVCTAGIVGGVLSVGIFGGAAIGWWLGA